MERQSIILIGGGGHCKSVIETIEAADQFKVAGILDIPAKLGLSVLGYPIIGTEEDIDSLSFEYFLITMGHIKDPAKRIAIYNKLIEQGKIPATVISSHAIVSARAKIGAGTVVMHGAKVNADAIIGKNCIINTNANIEHDAFIGDHVHVSTGAVINGGSIVEDGTFIGSNSTIVNGITIAARSVIGAGSVINKSITQPGIYVGNPGRIII